MFLHVFAAILHAQSVLINEISASELSQKFIKSALLVGLTHLGPSVVKLSSSVFGLT